MKSAIIAMLLLVATQNILANEKSKTIEKVSNRLDIIINHQLGSIIEKFETTGPFARDEVGYSYSIYCRLERALYPQDLDNRFSPYYLSVIKLEAEIQQLDISQLTASFEKYQLLTEKLISIIDNTKDCEIYGPTGIPSSVVRQHAINRTDRGMGPVGVAELIQAAKKMKQIVDELK